MELLALAVVILPLAGAALVVLSKGRKYTK